MEFTRQDGSKPFAIGKNRIHDTRVADVKAAKALTIMLEDDHRLNQPHQHSTKFTIDNSNHVIAAQLRAAEDTGLAELTSPRSKRS